MAKQQLSIILGIICLFFSINSSAQFPYAESFKNSTAKGIVFGGEPAAYLTAGTIDPEGDGYLRLTNNQLNQKGYIYSDAVLPSTFGLSVEFEYYTYGGTGADGICFFLFDATADPFNIGGFGGSLGYAQITTTNPVSPGVSKGYLGIGLDEWGNFSNMNEGRQGGIGQKRGSVTIRGKGDGAALTADNYKYLTSIQTLDFGFNLAGNKRPAANADPAYRRVRLELEPLAVTGYSVTVIITVGGRDPVTVIDKYEYPEEAPPLLRYGISSSTGASTNFHEIRNVVINVSNPNALINPTAVSDVLALCPGESGIVDVALNDTARNLNATLNRSSIDLNPSTSVIDQVFTVEGKGVFSVNNNGIVSFVPVNNTVLGDVSIQYSIRDTYGIISNTSSITARLASSSVTANAGPDQVINISSGTGSASLNARSSESNGRWTQAAGPSPARFDDPSSGSATVSDLIPGSYTFRWTVSPGTPCETFDEVEITVNSTPPPKIGLAKELATISKSANGSYDITYTFTIINYGQVDIEKVTLLDNFSSVFNGTRWIIKAIRASGTVRENRLFDGVTFNNLLDSTSRIRARDTATVSVDLNVLPDKQEGIFTNSAFTEGYSVIDGQKATDLSTNGLKPDPLTAEDISPSDPTPVELQRSTLFIPEGFSPNNDGRNDKFVVYNALGKKITLEIFNRWGNRIYRSGNYENDWDGRCTEGIHVGEDVPSGTYFYVIVLDNEEKYSGFLTINR